MQDFCVILAGEGKNQSYETSGHVSIASQGHITPYLTSSTIRLTNLDVSTSNISSQITPSHPYEPDYYLRLWSKVIKRKRLPYKIEVDTSVSKVCFRQLLHPAILWFDINDAMSIRNWYISFRLCGDDFVTFFKHIRQH